MTSVVLRAAAAAEVEEAYAWYEQQSEGMGDEFLSMLDRALESARAQQSDGETPAGVQRLLVRRFPYEVFFRHLGEQVVVLGCLHASLPARSWNEPGEPSLGS